MLEGRGGGLVLNGGGECWASSLLLSEGQWEGKLEILDVLLVAD
jgi:hypothetical protein